MENNLINVIKMFQFSVVNEWTHLFLNKLYINKEMNEFCRVNNNKSLYNINKLKKILEHVKMSKKNKI